MKKSIALVLILCGGLLLSVALSIILLFSTETGRIRLAETGLGLAATGTEYQLTWQGLTAPAFNRWQLQRLVLSGKDEVIFELRGLTLQWRPGIPLNRQIVVDNLEINELIITHVIKGEATGGQSTTPVFPLTISDFTVHKLTLRLPEMEQPRQYRISGMLQALTEAALLDAAIRVTPVPDGVFSFSADARIGRDGAGGLTGRYSETAQGYITRRLELPADEPFETSFRLDFQAEAAGYHVTIHDIASLLHNHAIKLQGDVQYSGTMLSLEQLRIDINESRHILSGTINDELDLQLQMNDLPLDDLSAWTGMTLDGGISGLINIKGKISDPQIDGDISADTVYNAVPLHAEFTGSADTEQVRINKLIIQSGANILARAAGSVALDGLDTDLVITTENTSLQLLRETGVEIPAELTGEISADTSLSGNLYRPDLSINGIFTGFYKGDVPINLAVTAEGEPARTASDSSPLNYNAVIKQFDLLIEHHQLSGKGQVNIAGSPATLSIEQALLSIAGTTHHLRGEISSGRLALNIELEQFPLDILAPLVAAPLTGTATASLFLGGTPAQPIVSGSIDAGLTYQQVPMELSAEIDATTRQVEIRRFNLKAGDGRINFTGSMDLVEHTGDLDVNAVHIDLVTLHHLGFSVPRALDGQLDANVLVKGSRDLPQLTGNARLTGHYREIPLDISLQGDGNSKDFIISQLKMTTENNAYLSIQGEYHATGSDFTLTARDLNSALSGFQEWELPPGFIGADVSFKGTIEQPEITGKLSYIRELPEQDKANTLSGINGNITLADNRLDIRLTLAENNERTGSLEISLPWRRYYQAIADPDNPDLPLYGEIGAEADLQDLCLLLLDSSIHQCQGKLLVNLTMSNSLQSPRMHGKINIIDGNYANILSGTSLSEIMIDILASGDRLEIVQAGAGDGERGEISMHGTAAWQETLQDHNFALGIQVKDAHLLRRYDMDGSVNGMLDFSGNYRESLLSGKLEVTPLTIYLQALLQEEIPELNVVDDADVARINAALNNEGTPIVHLDIEISAEQQAFLRGQGLEAELKGNIRIQDTVAAPTYHGAFKTIRGSVELLGKKFRLGDGAVRIENNTSSLFISALHQGSNLQVRADLSGTMDDLKLKLSSVPVLPEDEIISQLLFGKSAKSISPLQAVRLANAIATLKRSGKPLYDPLGKIERTLAIDRLTLEDGANGNGYSVGLGKYVHERVYVEVETGTGAGEPWQGNVQIELLPNLNLENTVNSETGFGNVELQWKKDF
jgi:translocation and assembly module TamB